MHKQRHQITGTPIISWDSRVRACEGGECVTLNADWSAHTHAHTHGTRHSVAPTMAEDAEVVEVLWEGQYSISASDSPSHPSQARTHNDTTHTAATAEATKVSTSATLWVRNRNDGNGVIVGVKCAQCVWWDSIVESAYCYPPKEKVGVSWANH